MDCAIIEHQGRVLVTQRSESMSLPFKWEFPGGKLNEGESAKESIVREIKEELGLEIEVLEELPSNTHTYETLTVTLIPFRCAWVRGELSLVEHAQAVWTNPEELAKFDWAPADVPIVERYLANLVDKKFVSEVYKKRDSVFKKLAE